MAVDYLDFFPRWAREAGGPASEPEWRRWRGMDVHMERVRNPDAVVKVVVLHGAGGYGGMMLPYARLVERVEVPGLGPSAAEVLAPDMPGYGRTRCNGRPVTYGTWVDLAAELIREERERDPRPVLVVGGSVGGMLAYSAVARAGAGALAVTCLLDVRHAAARAAAARFGPVGTYAGPVMNALRPFDGVRVPVRWIARMTAMANRPDLNAAVARDRLGGGGRVSLRFLRTYLASVPEVEPEEFTACPVVLAHPADDRWTPVELSLPFFERLASGKRLVMLEGCGHMPVEEPGLTRLAEALGRLVGEVTGAAPDRPLR